MSESNSDVVVEALAALEGQEVQDFNRILFALGQLIDHSGDTENDKALEKAIQVCRVLLERNISSQQRASLYYFTANAWSSINKIEAKGRSTSEISFSIHSEQELFNLRQAIRQDGFSTFPVALKCQIFTNIGNNLSQTGRFVESLEYWNKALDLHPGFAMALGNRGYGLAHYAKVLYDTGHRVLFLKEAYLALSEAIAGDVHDAALRTFKACQSEIEKVLGSPNVTLETPRFSLGDSEAERDYRKWCLNNRLFINPLNDLLTESIAAHDCLTTPNIVVALGEGPYFPGFYNQLKQEFVSARYLYYEGISTQKAHFSDRGVLLYDTLDYPSYALATEKVKLSFRAAYALFDKIAYFINEYFELNIPERSIYFRSIWYENGRSQLGLSSKLFARYNWPLVGLFWLSKDLYDKRFQDSMEPEAKAMYEVRNHLEHKYLKLHDSLWSGPLTEEDEVLAGLTDSLAYSMGRQEFEIKTLRLLKMVRAALIYLSLAIFVEEGWRASERGREGLIVGMTLDKFDDEWKV